MPHLRRQTGRNLVLFLEVKPRFPTQGTTEVDLPGAGIPRSCSASERNVKTKGRKRECTLRRIQLNRNTGGWNFRLTVCIPPVRFAIGKMVVTRDGSTRGKCSGVSVSDQS